MWKKAAPSITPPEKERSRSLRRMGPTSGITPPATAPPRMATV
jgi:hypothetical protein